ncbi:IclR family transcriptional regulator [Sphingomonas sp. 2R-10]|uniref:IclR family transcriptional regulator n=1 Tax=Sphingomonas sp. 2R-10 TaxID=3045148 RepID=UPI0019D304CA|nr:IclR family transcriptional regulator [Sphingomonas sp. 2R-10]MDJ0275727.1 IclR family transcriptional regulator [Sphingomonas sp. 2R-10]
MTEPIADAGGAARGTQTLMRGLDLVEALRDEPLRVAELARRLGLARTTTHRLAAALVERGYVAPAERGLLTLGPMLLQLGFTAHRRIDLVRTARARMEALSADTGLCVFLGRRDGDHSLHLDRAAGRRRLEVSTRPGDRRPVAQTGLGKALLFDEDDSGLARLHRATGGSDPAPWVAAMRVNIARGHVIHDSVGHDGIRSIAAPIRDVSRGIVAAVGIATAAQYLTDDTVDAIGPRVAATAQAISRDLGYSESDPSVPAA